MIREFKLLKTNESVTIDILGMDDLPLVLALQEETRAALPEAQKRFVLPQSRDYFASFLNNDNGLMLGIRCNGRLIAQMVIMGPLPLDEAMQRKAITRNEIEFHHAEQAEMVVIAKSMAVHPDNRGNELSQRMLAAALNLPIARTADHMFAQISAENVRSWELFLKLGFGIVAAVTDPGDNKPRFIVQKPALGFALHASASVVDIDPKADFSQISRLTSRELLIGFPDPTEDARLIFHASIDTATAWIEDERLQARAS